MRIIRQYLVTIITWYHNLIEGKEIFIWALYKEDEEEKKINNDKIDQIFK